MMRLLGTLRLLRGDNESINLVLDHFRDFFVVRILCRIHSTSVSVV